MEGFSQEGSLGRRFGGALLVLWLLVQLVLLAQTGAARAGEATFPFAQKLPGALGVSIRRGPLPGTIRMLKARVRGTSLLPSETEPRWACPESTCEELIDPRPHALRAGGRVRYAAARGHLYEGSGELGGLSPQDLQSAYRIPTSTGGGQTVALVDAAGDPGAEEVLAIYRKKYGLPPCTTANGCFEKINQHGEEANYPAAVSGWDDESDLDIEMVSAACPDCKIVLAEANTAYSSDLEAAVEAAARAGANEISNSYGGPEEGCEGGCAGESSAYDIPGVMVFASGGDSGYDDHQEGAQAPNSPASLPFVIAVGGTNLKKASNARGWEDTAWGSGGSGCSKYEPKPAWQHDPGCSHRMATDVAADASCETPVSVYDLERWNLVCGTSASSPLLAGIEAHASAFTRSLPGADAFYNDPQALYDVTAGSNGTCTPPAADAYFCQAQPGYDGPTGNGVPDGPLGVEHSPPDVDTLAPAWATSSSVELVGRLEAEGQQTSYRFEYGTSTAYGSSVPEMEGEVEAGYSGVTVRATVTGLEAGRTYHFRLVASNAAGTGDGADVSFDTAAPTVTSVSPGGGPPNGGTPVTIDGSHFDGATSVHFGQGEAPYFEVTSPGTITAAAPYGAGTEDVTVTTPDGTSEPGSGTAFTYGKPGSILGWGEDVDGSLGQGVGNAGAEVPLEVEGLREALQLAPGLFQSFALTGSGTVMSWGSGFGDGLGSYSAGDAAPAEVCAVATSEQQCKSGSYLKEVTAVASGVYFGLALLRDGRVVSWGDDETGDLGRPQPGKFAKAEDDLTPGYVCTTRKGTPAECGHGKYLEGVIAIAAGRDFALALLRNGAVMGWGNDNRGQLGSTKRKLSTCEPHDAEPVMKGPCSFAPVAIEGVSEASAIAAGDAHALALLKDGTVSAWGEDEEGQLGAGISAATSAPVTVCATGEPAPCAHALSGVKAIAAGDTYSTALLGDGHVVSWGGNYRGRLGDGSLEGPEKCHESPCSRSPIAVQGLEGVSTIAAGEENSDTLAITGSGQVFTWGGDVYGQLGDGLEEPEPAPMHVCAPFAAGPCPQGPYLEGTVTSVGVGGWDDLISMKIAPALVTEVSPKAGPGAGGTSVTITGSGFSGAEAVKFGSVPASAFEVRSNTEIVAIAPRGSGSVEVSVITPEGSSEPRPGDRYSYEEPVIDSLTPDDGPGAGGTRVIIGGTDLGAASAVDFGQNPASEFEVRSPQEIVAVAPPGESGVHVAVTTPDGTSAATEADWFTYLGPPTVVTEPAKYVHARSAWVSATVDPNRDKVTSCFVEYGTSTAYGSSSACRGEIGEGSEPVQRTITLEGLTPGATYHYRFVAENGLGVGHGEDLQFTTPSTALPELGRCVALAQDDGEFENESCTTRSASKNGGFEWEPGPGGRAGFKGAGKKVKLATQRAGLIECHALALEGAYSGPWSANVSHAALTGCEVAARGEGLLETASGSCQSQGASAGEILLDPLEATLGSARVSKKDLPGWGFRGAETGLLGDPAIANFDCGSVELNLLGGEIGSVDPSERATAGFAVKLKGASAPHEFLGEKSSYSLVFATVAGKTLTGFEEAYIAASVQLQGEEALEIKATE